MLRISIAFCMAMILLMTAALLTTAARFGTEATAAGPAATARMFTADFYLPGCKDFVAGRSNFFAGRCVGVVEVLDALNSDTKLFCPPDNVDNLQRVRTIVSYIEARPDRKNEDFRLLANEAMAKAWPCKKS
jgi:hypothetical protein